MRTYEAKNSEGKTFKIKAQNKGEALNKFADMETDIDKNTVRHVSKRELMNRKIAYLTSPESETYWCS